MQEREGRLKPWPKASTLLKRGDVWNKEMHGKQRHSLTCQAVLPSRHRHIMPRHRSVTISYVQSNVTVHAKCHVTITHPTIKCRSCHVGLIEENIKTWCDGAHMNQCRERAFSLSLIKRRGDRDGYRNLTPGTLLWAVVQTWWDGTWRDRPGSHYSLSQHYITSRQNVFWFV